LSGLESPRSASTNPLACGDGGTDAAPARPAWRLRGADHDGVEPAEPGDGSLNRGHGLPTDIWFKSAPRGGNLTTAAETHVTGPFNFLAAPNAGGFFLGDYEGLAANGTSFVGVDDITNCNTTSCGSNPTDTYAFGLP
jgi:hypothetical protein